MTVRDASSGNKAEIEVENSHYVSDIIETVAEHFRMPPGDYWLRRGKNNVDPGMTVAEAGLEEGDLLELVPSPIGG